MMTNQKHAPASWQESENTHQHVFRSHMEQCHQNHQCCNKCQEYQSLYKTEHELEICAEFSSTNRYCLKNIEK